MNSRRALLSLLIACAACGDDGGSPDAGGDDVCTTDDQCDDEEFCNGAELCDPGSRLAGADGCVSGTMPCPGATCDEANETCGMACSDPDADGDGYDSVECGGNDCDDSRAAVNPDATEICDLEMIDEDCDPTTLGDLDRDGDGYVDARCCNGDACGDDCDDNRANTSLLAPEVCDGFDNDCDGSVDEGATIMGYADVDRDLYGDPEAPMESCPGWPGISTSPMDCDDTNPDVHSARPEIMDGVDNDCDEVVDESPVATAWYADDDGDGFGTNDPSRSIVVFGRPAGYSQLFSDCDDTDADRNPGETELCNGVDDDCTAGTWYLLGPNDSEDDDGDGYPDSACPGVDGARADCDDTRTDVHPGAFETCDGEDDDCDGMVDEDCDVPMDAGVGDAGMPDGGPIDAGGPRCPPEGCMPPFPSTGADGDLILAGTDELTLPPGVYHYDRIDLGPNTVLRTNGTGVLELRARGAVVIRGQIDLAGGNGQNGRESSCGSATGGGGGGHVGRSGNAGRSGGCGVGGGGGAGDEGGRGEGMCANGGVYGGGAGARGQTGQAGGGGGGYAGGGGGASRAGTEASGGSGARELVSTIGGNGGSMGTVAQGGRTTVSVYDGEDGQARGGSGTSCAQGGGGGGGSIGESAATDLAVTTTFQPGSGGGGGGDGIYSGSRCGEGAGGGGGGGALRITSHESIIIANTARISVAGGAGGQGSGVPSVVSSASGGGGGGSGGVLYLASPSIRIDSGALVDASGGARGGVGRSCTGTGRGGAGGLGRIRLSVEPSTCTIDTPTMPPMPAAGCVPSGNAGEVYVGAYPN
ncbi:MAG: putative metal-binding motif-containing protein [Deltaproteobacteria bacterium]|nr:putative metal-binding motif-containing protein [Deltaproteobacteria bacterium]